MKSVFILWHTREIPEQEEDSKLIGVYESREEAERAKERGSKQPGFAEHPKGFLVDEHQIGKDHWTEGFVTVIQDGKEKEPNQTLEPTPAARRGSS